MPRGWPPLELREVLAILTALGFSYSHSKGGHDFYKRTRNGKPCSVTVDPKCAPFSVDLLQFMCKQAGSTRKEFYGATKATAAKIR
jgi:predicted RNA binding protein YcfA (HicA-like mRNA interferase family)